MKAIYGALLLLGDLLLKIPIAIWIVAFVIYILYSAITKRAYGNLYIALNTIFYFVLLNYIDITYKFIDCFGLGFLMPILLMIAVPFVAMILTTIILKLIFGEIN